MANGGVKRGKALFFDRINRMDRIPGGGDFHTENTEGTERDRRD